MTPELLAGLADLQREHARALQVVAALNTHCLRIAEGLGLVASLLVAAEPRPLLPSTPDLAAAPVPPRVSGRTRPGQPNLRALLLAALEAHGPHGAGALAVVCDDHKSRVITELHKMAAERLVHAQGQRRGQRWHLGAREVVCPASEETGHRVTCATCSLCRGQRRPAKHVVIAAHGPLARNVRLIQQHATPEGSLTR